MSLIRRELCYKTRMDSVEHLRERARELAIKRISRRETASYDLIEYLIAKGFGESIAASVVAELIERGFIDDRRFSEALVRHHASRGKGPQYIQNVLKRKRLALSNAELAGIVQERLGKSDVERAREIVERRYPRFRQDLKEANKAFQALVRRGFSFDVARKATARKDLEE